MLKLEDVSKSYRGSAGTVVAVADVSLSVQPGEMACLYGASGSGKTTLLNLVAGLDLPDSGAVMLDDTEVSALSEAKRARLRLSTIGVVFQDGNLIRELSAWENVALPLLGLGLGRRAARTQAQEALASVGIGDLTDRCPPEMSGGQRQRVGIARGLVGDRRLLVTDEPTGALDRENSDRLFQLLRQLAKERSIAVLVATHDPLAESHATTVLTMADGSVR